MPKQTDCRIARVSVLAEQSDFKSSEYPQYTRWQNYLTKHTKFLAKPHAWINSISNIPTQNFC